MLLLFPGENAARDTLNFAEEIAGYGLWQVDFATGNMRCSSNTYRLLGLEPLTAATEGGGKPLSFLTFETVAHPEDVPVITEIQHILAQGMPINRQFRVVHPNGRLRSMIIRGEVLIDRAGKPERVIGVLMDITRHVENITASQMNTDRIRIVMKSIQGAVWTARSDGSCTDFLLRDGNAMPSTSFLGHSWHAMLQPDDRDSLIRAWKKAAVDKLPFVHDHRVRGADGEYRWRRSFAAPVFMEDGGVREWVGMSLALPGHTDNITSDSPPVTGAQIRAARGILNWSVRDLSSRTGLSIGVVRRLEENDDAGKNAVDALNLIKDALSAGGVDFFALPGGEAGVYPSRKESRLKLVGKSINRKINSA